jgi:hypothetical protein
MVSRNNLHALDPWPPGLYYPTFLPLAPVVCFELTLLRASTINLTPFTTTRVLPLNVKHSTLLPVGAVVSALRACEPVKRPLTPSHMQTSGRRPRVESHLRTLRRLWRSG